MADAGAAEFAEFGAAALDAFQALFEETEHLDHRGNTAHASELLGDLLIDLMHYADHRGLEFNDILAQANGYYLSEHNSPDVLAIGTTIQLNGPAAEEAILLGAPTRGTVTGLLVPYDGPTEYDVHFLGETSSRSIIAADLEPAPSFPATSTSRGVIGNPLRAEETLIETMARIGRADLAGIQPQQDDLDDHHVILDALVAWNGMDQRNVTDLLLAKVEPRLTASPLHPASDARLDPAAELAAHDFPIPLSQSLAEAQPAAQPSPRPAGPAATRSHPR
ncbi:hypothetical protein [Actinomadura bangladeshensis]|uniref:Uncharacterized protein n=1 Tax=Actinomadura bangladeshensis TaxID=453573 RepID=A0A4R4NIX7_9ACTN|nr:hypothetical protein [Actinomadura bangladeshensis]TDC06882.1 hypothetical protein E1284_33220 [Actinomadura bangladeshensis]